MPQTVAQERLANCRRQEVQTDRRMGVPREASALVALELRLAALRLAVLRPEAVRTDRRSLPEASALAPGALCWAAGY